MATVSSRKPPWPDDLKIGTYGMRLVDGTLIGRKTQTLENVAPTTQEYDSAPVYKERTFAFRPTRGMGERVQSSHTSRRYRYGLRTWFRGGLFGKGPLTHSISPASTGSIVDFVEGLHNGTLAQFILASRYVLRRTDDTNGGQVVSHDFTPNVVTSAVRFKGAYVTPIDGLYVATSAGALWERSGAAATDAAAWTACTLPAGFSPLFLERVGDELWAADNAASVVRKCTGDPKLAGSWGGPIQIGDTSVRISNIKQTLNRLFIFKEDGTIFSTNGDGSDNDVLPGFRTTPDPLNAAQVAQWDDALWFRIGGSFYKLTAFGGPVISPVGPEKLRGNDSEVRGDVQAFAGWGVRGAYAAVYNSALGNSYGLTFGDWQVSSMVNVLQTDAGTASAQFVEQWDGSFATWTGKRVLAMKVSGVASPDTRLYVGFNDGTWDWIKLVDNPFAASSGAEFTLAASKVYIPLHHAMFQADWKTTNGFSGFGPVLSGQDYVQIAYRTDGSTAAYVSVPGSITTTGQRLDTQNSTPGHLLDVELTLVNTTTADTPVLEGVAIHESVRPALKRDYSGAIDARSHVARRDGSTSRLQAEDIRDVVLQAAGAPGAVTLMMPDEVTQPLSFFGYQETLLPRQDRNGLGWRIDFQATEFKTHTVYGTVGRLKGVLIGDLKGVLIGTLRSW